MSSSIHPSCRRRWPDLPILHSGKLFASMAGPVCRRPKWSMPEALPGWTNTMPNTPTDYGASGMKPRPLAVQIWDNQPETLAKVGKRLVEEYESASSTSISVAPCDRLPKKPKAAVTCCNTRNRWVGLSSKSVRLGADPGNSKNSAGMYARQNQRHRRGPSRRSRRARWR